MSWKAFLLLLLLLSGVTRLLVVKRNLVEYWAQADDMCV